MTHLTHYGETRKSKVVDAMKFGKAGYMVTVVDEFGEKHTLAGCPKIAPGTELAIVFTEGELLDGYWRIER